MQFFAEDLDTQLKDMQIFNDRVDQEQKHYVQMKRAARRQKRLKLMASKKFGKK